MNKNISEIHLVVADENGNIYDDPELLMICRRGNEWGYPRKEDLMPLPDDSDLFLLPGRNAIGLDKNSGEATTVDQLAVAAFISPGHTINSHPVWEKSQNAPLLPLFAYAAVGYANDRFYVCAKKVDNDPRQQFSKISINQINKQIKKLLNTYPKNRLIGHILNNCVLKYSCPAAKNFALGRYEAPLPTATACNARCIGCISFQEKDSPIKTTPQCRMHFIPTVDEIVEVMQIHESREKKSPIYSFGQGCEGDPLTNADLLINSVNKFRKIGGTGTINCNTNGSIPNAIIDLAKAGLTSIRISMNSTRKKLYDNYYRPQGYTFKNVCESLKNAHNYGLFTSINLLFFPGITDSEAEVESLIQLIQEYKVSMIQWRNLNIDPDWYIEHFDNSSPSIGLSQMQKRIKKQCPWIQYGYFNPWIDPKTN